jgi:hypothetical protein
LQRGRRVTVRKAKKNTENIKCEKRPKEFGIITKGEQATLSQRFSRALGKPAEVRTHKRTKVKKRD